MNTTSNQNPHPFECDLDKIMHGGNPCIYRVGVLYIVFYKMLIFCVKNLHFDNCFMNINIINVFDEFIQIDS